MRERRSFDRGIESRSTNEPHCDLLSSETLARYLTWSLPKTDLGTVEAHLQRCDECWAVLDRAGKLFGEN
jgi:hypothetical protein